MFIWSQQKTIYCQLLTCLPLSFRTSLPSHQLLCLLKKYFSPPFVSIRQVHLHSTKASTLTLHCTFPFSWPRLPQSPSLVFLWVARRQRRGDSHTPPGPHRGPSAASSSSSHTKSTPASGPCTCSCEKSSSADFYEGGPPQWMCPNPGQREAPPPTPSVSLAILL